jgi:hypothetical protein
VLIESGIDAAAAERARLRDRPDREGRAFGLGVAAHGSALRLTGV